MTSVETAFITANGIGQHVALAGAPTAPAVVLVHGLGWDHTLWRTEAANLAAAGWRVIMPDLRGMGRTDKPASPFTLDSHAEDLTALLDALAIRRAALVGFSLGGMIALAMAARTPARVGALFVACASAYSTPAGAVATEAMLARARTLGPRQFAEEQAQAIWSRKWARDHDAEVRRFIAWRAGMDQAALARAFRAAHGVDLRPELGRVTAPARVLVAAEDSFVAIESGRALAAALPDADFVVIENAGHMVSLEQPVEFLASLREFLDRAWPCLRSETAARQPA